MAYIRPINRIAEAFANLATVTLDMRRQNRVPDLEVTIRSLLDELQHHVPGLQPPLNVDLADVSLERATRALASRRPWAAVIHALRGLSGQPHSPQLFYALATAVIDLHYDKLGPALLIHVLWLNPGHTAARTDLEALAYGADDEDQPE